MEDYEKKYKDTLAKAREIHRNESEKRFDMEWLFPELKESEDERIRKEMITAFSRLEEDSTLCGVAYNYKKWIAWLEKQGELTQSVTKKSDKVWSEEDENMANDLIEGFLSSEKIHHLAHSSKEIADWLKSIKDRIGG